MGVNNIGNVDSKNGVGIGKDNVLLLDLIDVLLHSLKSLHMSGEHSTVGGMRGLERRNKGDTTLTSCKIPVLTATKMLEERTVLVVRYNVNVGNISVYHIGKRKVNQSVTACERNSRNRSVTGQSGKCIII